MGQARWADAIWHWDILVALNAQDAEALTQRAKATTAAATAVAKLWPAAQQARQQANWDNATRLYLDILLLDPSHTEAADALRSMEIQRTRRGVVTGSFGLYSLQPGRGQSQGTTESARAGAPRTASAAKVPLSGPDTMVLEHASLLAAQGEVEAAISVLRPIASDPSRTDVAAFEYKRRLADLYFLRASQLEASDPAGAIAALESGLAYAPSNLNARNRLKALRTSAETPSRKRR